MMIRYDAPVGHIGAAIKAKRKPLMTQGEFAARLGLTQPSVSAWEREESLPTADILPKIARVLGCSLDDLMSGIDGEYDRTRTVTSSGSPPVQTGSSNASDPYAPATPRRADDGPATRRLEPVTIPDHLDAAQAAVYLNELSRDLSDTIAARIRAVAEALSARELESAVDVTAGVRAADRPHDQPHARRRRAHRRGA
jgi:transcriptional regulator with XRE-family HTH domain